MQNDKILSFFSLIFYIGGHLPSQPLTADSSRKRSRLPKICSPGALSPPTWTDETLIPHGHIGRSAAKNFIRTKLIILYGQFYKPFEATGKQNILIDKHAIYSILMDLNLSIGLVWEHPSKVNHTFTPRWKDWSILFTVLWAPNC